MTDIFTLMSPIHLVLVMGIAILAGLVKGMVGFAMPMVLISGMAMFLSPELALAGLIFPTLATNGLQALRQGGQAAWHSVKRFRIFLGVGLVCLLIGAQMVTLVPQSTFYLLIGVAITGFALLQLAGWGFTLDRQTIGADLGIGMFAGFIGGMSGVWGPPTVAYLTALNTPKDEQMRIQGVIYGLGAVALVFAHIGSGVLTRQTAVFSALVIPPAVLGMWIGQRLQGQMDQTTFRRITLIVLLVAGANLVRRGLY